MSATFAARIPYNEPSTFGARYTAGDLTRRPGHRRPLPILDAAGRDTLGKVLRLDPTPDSLRLLVDLGASTARPIVADLNRSGGYYVEPWVARGELIALRVSAVETWPAAELTPASAPALPAPRARRPRSPIGPRPVVNLTPDLGSFRFTR